MARYKGKYTAGRWRFPLVSVMLVLLALTTLFAGSVAAYLVHISDQATNEFTAETEVIPTILETFEEGVKKNVTVDIGDPGYAVYVRAAIVVSWQDESGNVLGKPPVLGTDYEMTLGANWEKKADGFYYYKEMVMKGETDPLIVECQKKTENPGEYSLHVEILAQTIQALGTTDENDRPAIQDAWSIIP